MNQDHHSEQMEALRKEFEELWATDLCSRWKLFDPDHSHMVAANDIAWQAFRYGKIKD